MAPSNSEPTNDALARDLFELSRSQAIRGMEIGGRVYAIGDLSEAQRAQISEIGTGLGTGDHTRSTRELGPLMLLGELLRAGDPDLDLCTVEGVRPEHHLLAGREVRRQFAVMAFNQQHKGSA